MHLISSHRGQHGKPTTSTGHGTQEASLWTAELKNTLRTKSRALVPDPMWISCMTWRRHFIVWASVLPTLKAAGPSMTRWHGTGKERTDRHGVQVPWVLEFYNFRQMASFLWISISSYPLNWRKCYLPPAPPNLTGFGANKEAHLRNPWQRQIYMSISRSWVTGVHLVNLSTVLFTCLSVLLESKVLRGRASLSIFLHLIKK